MFQDIKSKIVSTAISASIGLSLISAIGYLGAYLFEVGFLNHYGITYQSAQVTTEGFIIFSMACITVCAAMVMYRDGLTLLVMPLTFSNPVLTYVARTVRFAAWIVILLFPINAYYRLFNTRFVIYAAALYVIVMAFDVIAAGWGVKGISQKFQKALDRPADKNDQQNRPYVLVVVAAAFFVTLCPFLGTTFADSRKNYEALPNNELIVRRYGDTVLLAGYNPTTSELTGNYRYANLDANVSFRIVHIKHLERP
jgi:hypothetical protein